MSDEKRTRWWTKGRFSKEDSKVISENISQALLTKGLSIADLAATLGQSSTNVSKKLRCFTTWSQSDIDTMEKAFGPGWLSAPSTSVSISESSSCAASAYGNATVHASAAFPDDPRTAADFLSRYSHLLTPGAIESAKRYAAMFPTDKRTAADWLNVLAAFADTTPQQKP